MSGSPMGLAIYYDDPNRVASADVRFKVAMLVASETEPISAAGAAIECCQHVIWPASLFMVLIRTWSRYIPACVHGSIGTDTTSPVHPARSI